MSLVGELKIDMAAIRQEQFRKYGNWFLKRRALMFELKVTMAISTALGITGRKLTPDEYAQYKDVYRRGGECARRFYNALKYEDPEQAARAVATYVVRTYA